MSFLVSLNIEGTGLGLVPIWITSCSFFHPLHHPETRRDWKKRSHLGYLGIIYQGSTYPKDSLHALVRSGPKSQTLTFVAIYLPLKDDRKLIQRGPLPLLQVPFLQGIRLPPGRYHEKTRCVPIFSPLQRGWTFLLPHRRGGGGGRPFFLGVSVRGPSFGPPTIAFAHVSMDLRAGEKLRKSGRKQCRGFWFTTSPGN